MRLVFSLGYEEKQLLIIFVYFFIKEKRMLNCHSELAEGILRYV